MEALSLVDPSLIPLLKSYILETSLLVIFVIGVMKVMKEEIRPLRRARQRVNKPGTRRPLKRVWEQYQIQSPKRPSGLLRKARVQNAVSRESEQGRLPRPKGRRQ